MRTILITIQRILGLVFAIAFLTVLVLGTTLRYPEHYRVVMGAVRGEPVGNFSWQISVPPGWVAYSGRNENEAVVATLPWRFWRERPTLITVRSFEYLEFFRHDEESWRRSEVPALRAHGYEFIGARYLPAAERNVYCVEGVANHAEPSVYLECILFGAKLTLGFEGYQRHLPVFYRTAEQLRKTSPPN